MIRGELFFFKSGYVWRIRDGHLESGYPALASRHWRGIPSNIDAAFEDKSGNIWFLQGERDGSDSLFCRFGFLGKIQLETYWNTSVLFTQKLKMNVILGVFFDVSDLL